MEVHRFCSFKGNYPLEKIWKFHGNLPHKFNLDYFYLHRYWLQLSPGYHTNLFGEVYRCHFISRSPPRQSIRNFLIKSRSLIVIHGALVHDLGVLYARSMADGLCVLGCFWRRIRSAEKKMDNHQNGNTFFIICAYSFVFQKCSFLFGGNNRSTCHFIFLYVGICVSVNSCFPPPFT